MENPLKGDTECPFLNKEPFQRFMASFIASGRFVCQKTGCNSIFGKKMLEILSCHKILASQGGAQDYPDICYAHTQHLRWHLSSSISDFSQMSIDGRIEIPTHVQLPPVNLSQILAKIPSQPTLPVQTKEKKRDDSTYKHSATNSKPLLKRTYSPSVPPYIQTQTSNQPVQPVQIKEVQVPKTVLKQWYQRRVRGGTQEQTSQ
eukprot:TRINITY_DN15674_c0_g1_i4.p1 TRINITY_DN15674_c0_g1~~TRINITY_DN15674_c0_g1_i4.p1  ORF type:complete len:203 (+),score=34.19 TRINITY_DN15674_c0_g1_i4:36-644(+)